MMRRRDFITLLGGAAVVWPLAARAQQPERMRRIGVLMTLAAGDPLGVDTPVIAVIRQALNETGLVDGQNVTLDYRS